MFPSFTVDHRPTEVAVEAKSTSSSPSPSSNALVPSRRARGLAETSRRETVLTPEEKVPYQRFGHSTKVDQANNGVFINTNRNNRQGTIYKYCFDETENQFKQVVKMQMPPLDNRGFGLSFDADQGHMMVGAPFDHGDQGSVFVYYSDSKSCSGDGYSKEVSKLTPAEASGPQKFGSALSVSFPFAVIGAQYDSSVLPDAGSAYLFAYTGATNSEDNTGGTWVQQVKLAPLDLSQSANYGASVNVNKDWILVSAPGDSYTYELAGSAYVYSNEAPYTNYSILFPKEPYAFGRFGTSTFLFGNTAFISAVSQEGDSGLVYVFSYANKWNQEAILTPPSSSAFDRFGSSIYALNGDSASNDVVFIGAPNSLATVNDRCYFGNVFAYGNDKPNWNYLGAFEAAIPPTQKDDGDVDDKTSACVRDGYGSSIGFANFGNDQSQLLIGAELAASSAGKTGEVYAEANLVSAYFSKNLLLQQQAPSSNSGSGISSWFGSNFSFSILAVVAVVMLLPLVVMTGFLVKRRYNSRIPADAEGDSQNTNPMVHTDSDRTYTVDDASEDNKEEEYLDSVEIKSANTSALKSWVSKVYSNTFAGNTTKFSSIPAENNATLDVAELGECPNDSTEYLNRSSVFTSDVHKYAFQVNSPIAVVRSFPQTSVVKYNSNRLADDEREL